MRILRTPKVFLCFRLLERGRGPTKKARTTDKSLLNVSVLILSFLKKHKTKTLHSYSTLRHHSLLPLDRALS